jgi:hypothetical protein
MDVAEAAADANEAGGELAASLLSVWTLEREVLDSDDPAEVGDENDEDEEDEEEIEEYEEEGGASEKEDDEVEEVSPLSLHPGVTVTGSPGSFPLWSWTNVSNPPSRYTRKPV